ncbi:bcl-2-like protein 1 isoform X2 [Mya arenaria]|uniref:bcl-2-like protein 1 isoform X2 n=1 Tax=Mya arenaria TaxID=6604 RepID=UPI0022E765DA|nr:bcl-2-like protein 1 isoform X2 [Mya arenaria]
MSDFVSMTELITQDYLCYQLQKSGYDFETFSKWPTVYCQGCKSKLETDVFTRCFTCEDSKMYTVPEEKSDEAQCQRELKLMRKTCDIFEDDFEKGFEIDTANINPNKATVLITLLQEADNLFKNETNSKGIVYLLIISGELAKKCAEKGYDSEVNSIQRITSWYINEKLGPWINEHGGWECFFKWSESINKFYDAFMEIVLHFMAWIRPGVLSMESVPLQSFG